MKTLALCMTGTLALACASCSNKGNLYPVTGKVTYNGLPASGAVVFFHPQPRDPSKQTAILGIVAEDGSFELVSGPLGKGAPPGDYDVLVEWKRVTGHGRRRGQTGSDILRGRYADPRHPLLHATVEAKATNLPVFELIDLVASQAEARAGGRR